MIRIITIVEEDGSKHRVSGDQLPVKIGSSEDCHLKLAGDGSVEAYIGDSQGHLFIQPAADSKTEIFHNNRFLSESAWLKAEDLLQIGKSYIRYEIHGDKVFLFKVKEPEVSPAHHGLEPPKTPPPDSRTNLSHTADIPVNVASGSTGKRTVFVVLLTLLFCILLGATTFVIFARPLKISVTPAYDRMSIKGFLPAIRLQSKILCIPGTYTIEISKNGYHTILQKLTVESSGENNFTYVLKRLPGILQLKVTPPEEVSVYSDDTLIGTTPPPEMSIDAGKHSLSLTKPRYKPFTREIEIRGMGQRQQVEATLEPDWAPLKLTTEPPGADIYIDGIQKGTTPLTLELLSGSHDVSFQKELYQDHTLKVEVVASEPQDHHVDLILIPSQLTITSDPLGAAVTIDSEYHGITPITASVSSGIDHDIAVTLPGYKSVQQRVTPDPGKDQSLSFKLAQETGIIFLTTNPPGATVTINGKRYKNTHGKLELPAQSQVIQVTAPGYKSATRTILPRLGVSQQLTIELKADDPQGEKQTITTPSPQSQNLLVTTTGQKLVKISPSAFTMGAPRREPGRRANERQHTVVMKRVYLLSEKPVTNKEYRQFKPEHKSGMFSGFSLDTDDQPVVNVSWEDAVGYLNWLSQKDGLQPFYVQRGSTFTPVEPLTNGYRLPTEAEWAFGARVAGNKTQLRFPWGDRFPPGTVKGNYADESARNILPRIIFGYHDRSPVTSPVGSFPRNRGGLYDMGGNISEWCHDYYAPDITMSNRADPLGPPSGSHRVIRGSSWRDATVTELRLSYRAYHREARDHIGFRIARYE